MNCLPQDKRRGSVTIEAAIAFPVFLSFFLLLAFFIKIACINITLDHAVNETAKQLAASCYPITFLNDLEDDLLQEGIEFQMPSIEEELKKIGEYVKSGIDEEDIFAKLITGEFTAKDVKELVNNVIERIKEDYKDGLRSYLSSRYSGDYFSLKTKVKYAVVTHLMEKFLQEGMVDAGKIELKMIELPQGIVEYELKSRNEANRRIYEEWGLVPDPDNIVIAVEYSIKVPIPFFPEKGIVTRHVAVERAWLHGSSGVYEAWSSGEDDEKGKDSEDGSKDNGDSGDDIVYVTNYGKKYHADGCEYLKKSRKPISREYAVQKGYSPCKVCILKTAEYVWKKK